MPTATRVRVPPSSSIAAVLPDEVPSVAGDPNESGNESGFHGTGKIAGDIAAAEEESGRKKKEDGTPKNQKYKQWEDKFKELAVYKEKDGNCNVPRSQGTLGTWVRGQRASYKKGKLSQDRTAQLEGIGFNWGVRKQKSDAEQWEERFNELALYEEKNGTYNVSGRQGALGRWVARQRQFYRKGKLSQERATQLEGIRFNWGTRKQKSGAEQWEESFHKLAVYKEKNGTCNVPRSQGALGRWAMTQRQCYTNGKLLGERATQLEGIGFEWKLTSRQEKASTRTQSNLPADGSHEEAGNGSNDSVTGMCNFECSTLPPLPYVQEE